MQTEIQFNSAVEFVGSGTSGFFDFAAADGVGVRDLNRVVQIHSLWGNFSQASDVLLRLIAPPPLFGLNPQAACIIINEAGMTDFIRCGIVVPTVGGVPFQVQLITTGLTGGNGVFGFSWSVDQKPS